MFRGAFVENSGIKLDHAVAEFFLDRLAPPFAPFPVCLEPSPSSNTDNDNLQRFNSPFSLLELKNVLSYVKDSAPGCDGIPYSFLTHSSDNIQIGRAHV